MLHNNYLITCMLQYSCTYILFFTFIQITFLEYFLANFFHNFEVNSTSINLVLNISNLVLQCINNSSPKKYFLQFYRNAARNTILQCFINSIFQVKTLVLNKSKLQLFSTHPVTLISCQFFLYILDV